MDHSIAELLVKSIWFAGPQYEEAVARSEERIAGAHADLKVEGKGISSTGASSGIESIIGQAKSMIEESLRSTTKPAGDSSAPVSQLEKENAALKKRVSELESFIKSKGLSLPGTTPTSQKSEPAAAKDDDSDDDFDPFASEDEEEKAEAQRLKEERLAAMEEKKKCKKPGPIAKSSIILDVKPWDDETDMGELERQVRDITMDGLQWKGSELKEIAYGIKKLQIICVVEDDKVGTDDLEEQICGLEDLVQSMDIMAFNKL